MQESVAMLPEDATPKSPLDKPLQQLTEDDISQITREDCRRYLKEKGMRRPSWNKSQAIQQVIMLKRLFETTTSDTEAEPLKKLCIPRPNNANNNEYDDNPQHVSEGTLELAEEKLQFLRKGPGKPDSSGDLSGSLVAANNESAHPRTLGSTNIPAGQMTIFYCGKVNVYDDVPADKVCAIMHFAASPLLFPQEPPFDSSVTVQPSPCHSQPVTGNVCPDSATMLSPTLQTAKMSDDSRLHGEESNILQEDYPAEGPSARKASVQRYLEKKKTGEGLRARKRWERPRVLVWTYTLTIKWVIRYQMSTRGELMPAPHPNQTTLYAYMVRVKCTREDELRRP